MPLPLTGVCGVWIYGEAGCGKTTSVFGAWPSIFSKPLNKWWDGYNDESHVLYDDISIYHRELGTQLKHAADFAPFGVEKKGSQEKIRPSRIVVTSQYTIEQIWEAAQLLEGRRVHENCALWIFTPRAIKSLADRNGYTRTIEQAGGVLMTDSFSAMSRAVPEGTKVVALDSAKQAHYLPAILGVQAWFGTTVQCIDAACTGRWGAA